MGEKKYIRVLTIAGSDSGGGAGIQADLKTVSALGCYGMSAITALTAQNTVAVHGIFDIPADFVALQIDAVMEDIGVDAVKIGMLSRPDIIKTVAERLKYHRVDNIVLDPVMVAKSGDRLLQEQAVEALKTELIPHVRLLTPNIPEAEWLSGRSITSKKQVEDVAELLLTLGPEAALIKGGHFHGRHSEDFLLRKTKKETISLWLPGKRLTTQNTHGTGCTLSSAISAYLARGEEIQSAVMKAKSYISRAIAEGAEYSIGAGHGPVHHFHELWPRIS